MKTDGIFLQSGLLLLSLTFYKRLSPLPNSFLTSTKAESKQPTENEHCLFRRLPNKPSELRISSVELDSYKAHLPSLKPFFIILFFFSSQQHTSRKIPISMVSIFHRRKGNGCPHIPFKRGPGEFNQEHCISEEYTMLCKYVPF